jgi:hypothetical protein
VGSGGGCGTIRCQRERRAVAATTDPQWLPVKATWYLVTNLPHPASELATESELAPVRLSEIVRLYALRMWVEQSYKQLKHVLGWSDYQVSSDLSIPVTGSWCAVRSRFVGGQLVAYRPGNRLRRTTIPLPPNWREGEKAAQQSILAGEPAGGKGVVGALQNAHAMLEGVLRDAPITEAKSAA